MKKIIGALAVAIGVLGAFFWMRDDAASSHGPAVQELAAAANATSKTPSPAAKSSPQTKRTAVGSASPQSAPSIEAECLRLLATDSPTQRQLGFSKLLSETRDEAALRAILGVFMRLGAEGKRHGDEWSLFWAEMVSRSPKFAADLAVSLKDKPDSQRGAVAMVSYEWARRDPQAVMAWLDSQPDLPQKTLDSATVNLIGGYADKDLHGATRYAMEVIPEGDSAWGDTAWVLTSTAMNRGGEVGLTSWFEGLPLASKQRLFFSTANALNRKSRETQVNWLTNQASNPWRDDKSYREVAQAWADTEPQAALEWLYRLPPSPKEGGIVGIGYAAFPWMVKDLEGFKRYFHSLPPERQKPVIDSVSNAVTNPKMDETKRQAGNAFLGSLKK
jgi:hypothetical protein